MARKLSLSNTKLPTIIAEVKTQSPFGFHSTESWDELFDVAESIGDIISIHTDARWGGSMELISKARAKTDKLILAKGIHPHDDQIESALNAGADFVLVVGRIPNIHAEKCLIEPLSLHELKEYSVKYPHLRMVWNSRDLETGGLKLESFAEARKIFKGWLCQASNIRTVSDVHRKADAVLVGTSVREFRDSVKKKLKNSK